MNTANHRSARIHRPGLWRAAGVALAILLFTSPAFAAQPLTGTFKGKVIGRFVNFTNPTTKKLVTDWAGVLNLQLDRDTPGDGLGPLVPVFCIQVNVLVRGGDRYKSDGPVTALHGGCQIRYLLDRYPSSTASTADEAAARQLAIWHFSDDVDLTTVQDPALQARATALADEAALAVALNGCPGSQANVASLTLSPPTASVVAGQVVNYTVQADPPSAAPSVNIVISGTATLQNGLQQATLPLVGGAASFSVVNPVAGISTITARLPYVLDAGTVFSPINAAKPTQRLVMGDRVSLSASATVQAAWGQATVTPVATSTATPPIGSPTGTPLAGLPTATPLAGTPTGTPLAGLPTATPMGGTPTGTPLAGSPTAAPPTHATPVEAPPVTPTKKPSGGGGSKPSPTQATQGTPESTPTTEGGSPPNGTPNGTPAAGGAGPTAPTPIGGAGEQLPGGATGAGALRPSQLPNTGGSGGAAIAAIAIAALLIACGLWLRKGTVRD